MAFHLPIAMKLRVSWTVMQDTTVGLLPGIAGKILVQRGFPPSRFSKFQTLTCKQHRQNVSRYGLKVYWGHNLVPFKPIGLEFNTLFLHQRHSQTNPNTLFFLRKAHKMGSCPLCHFTYQRVNAFFIFTNRSQDAVLLQLVQVSHPQLVSLETAQLKGAWQEPDLTFHM